MTARVRDAAALRRARQRARECASCGRPPANVHHVVPRGAPHFGDDVDANLLPVCGSGTMGCHGAFHGSPYVDGRGRRWTQADVARRLGLAIADRRDILSYVLGKLGDQAGREFLRRRYHLEV